MAEPKVRFKKADGMTYPSLQKAIMGDFYTERNERGNENLPVLTVSIHSGVSDGELDEDELGKRVKRSSDLTQYKKAVEGDLVFNMMRAWQGAVGSVKTTGMVSPAYIVAEPNSNIDPSFMDYYVQSKPVIDRFNRLSYGALDFRKRLYWDSFVTTEVNIPVIEEQQKIADFLSSVDEIITASEEEVANLETQKKAVMKKIFSQEVRFRKADGSDFQGWEEKPLGTVAGVYDGTHQTPEYVAEGIKFVSVENISNLFGSNKYITEDAFLKQYKNNAPQKGDVLMTRIGDIGTAALVSSDEQLAYYVSLALLKPSSVIRPNYLVQAIASNFFQSELWIRTLHTAYPKKINKEDIGKCLIQIPCLEEQRLIADFLSNFDEAIAAAKKELELWKELKKGLLQQMFV